LKKLVGHFLKIINVDLLMTKEEETSKEEATNKKAKV